VYHKCKENRSETFKNSLFKGNLEKIIRKTTA